MGFLERIISRRKPMGGPPPQSEAEKIDKRLSEIGVLRENIFIDPIGADRPILDRLEKEERELRERLSKIRPRS